jgi:hypothetical protein
MPLLPPVIKIWWSLSCRSMGSPQAGYDAAQTTDSTIENKGTVDGA